MPVLCIDIGNSFAHMGLVESGKVIRTEEIPTPVMLAGQNAAGEVLKVLSRHVDGISYASVVPKATVVLERHLDELGLKARSFNLRHDTVRGLGFDYPNPAEVGQDRIANCVAIQELFGLPAVGVYMGTATVLDILTPAGYAGGIIAPGLAMMTDYLHERTAQLPRLERLDLETGGAIGKSSVDAMKIGARIGFRGMIRESLAAVLDQMRDAGCVNVPVVTTGGNAGILPEGWWPGAVHVRHLSLKGLEISWRRVSK